MIKQDLFIKVRIGSDLFERFCCACRKRGIKRSAMIRTLITIWLQAEVKHQDWYIRKMEDGYHVAKDGRSYSRHDSYDEAAAALCNLR